MSNNYFTDDRLFWNDPDFKTTEEKIVRKLKVEGLEIDPFKLNWLKFRKKPVLVEAIRMENCFTVETLEGTMFGNAGDYLIRGIEGELYPCKSDIFKKTYEECQYDYYYQEINK